MELTNQLATYVLSALIGVFAGYVIVASIIILIIVIMTAIDYFSLD